MSSDSDRGGATFIHLRTHSAYSLSEGALPVKQLAELAKTMKMPAVAITDTGNLFGALEFSETCAEKGLQPIIGCSLKVDMAEREPETPGRAAAGFRRFPTLALIAKDEEGYRNLMKLSGRAYLDTGDGAEPHVPLALIERHSTGLICLSGGPQGPLNGALIQGQTGLARSQAETLRRIFGDRFYIELQRHGMAEERQTEPGLVEIAYDLDIPLVASNEAYFPQPEDFAAHDALICIAAGEVIATEDRRRLTPEHYFKPSLPVA
jgi:DNA polymerase-3 subunit alpha